MVILALYHSSHRSRASGSHLCFNFLQLQNSCYRKPALLLSLRGVRSYYKSNTQLPRESSPGLGRSFLNPQPSSCTIPVPLLWTTTCQRYLLFRLRTSQQHQLLVTMPPKQATLGYVHTSQRNLGCTGLLYLLNKDLTDHFDPQQVPGEIE